MASAHIKGLSKVEPDSTEFTPEQLRSVLNQIRIVMRQKGFTTRKLAKMTGYSPDYMRQIITGTLHSPKARLKIETALGHPFWSNASQTSQPT